MLVGVLLLAVLVIAGVLSSLSPSSRINLTSSNSRTWQTITSFSGSGDKNTSPFQISGTQFRLQWQYTTDIPQYASFSFFVYPEGETARYADSMSQDGLSKSDTEYVYHGPGGFYITVITANLQSWSITVQDYS
ncbi:MAG: hypothetical protein AUJ07_08125 [Crenarchaeota archaeon 13_1_40CM_3_53_5]|nr:MAG: hypothetical protein AUJ07_08125 [Crenarchaeota archaeon 13_1_40CM_3_53_5]